MKQYLLSLYQPEGDPPAPEVLETIMGDLEVRRNPEPSIPLAVEQLAAVLASSDTVGAEDARGDLGRVGEPRWGCAWPSAALRRKFAAVVRSLAGLSFRRRAVRLLEAFEALFFNNPFLALGSEYTVEVFEVPKK